MPQIKKLLLNAHFQRQGKKQFEDLSLAYFKVHDIIVPVIQTKQNIMTH